MTGVRDELGVKGRHAGSERTLHDSANRWEANETETRGRPLSAHPPASQDPRQRVRPATASAGPRATPTSFMRSPSPGVYSYQQRSATGTLTHSNNARSAQLRPASAAPLQEAGSPISSIRLRLPQATRSSSPTHEPQVVPFASCATSTPAQDARHQDVVAQDSYEDSNAKDSGEDSLLNSPLDFNLGQWAYLRVHDVEGDGAAGHSQGEPVTEGGGRGSCEAGEGGAGAGERAGAGDHGFQQHSEAAGSGDRGLTAAAAGWDSSLSLRDTTAPLTPFMYVCLVPLHFCVFRLLSRSLALSRSFALSLSLALSLTLALSRSLALSFSRSLSLSLSRALALARACDSALALAFSRSRSL